MFMPVFPCNFYRVGFTKSLQYMLFLALPSILIIFLKVVSFCKFPSRCKNIQSYHFIELPHFQHVPLHKDTESDAI